MQLSLNSLNICAGLKILGNVEHCGASVSKQCTVALNCYIAKTLITNKVSDHSTQAMHGIYLKQGCMQFNPLAWGECELAPMSQQRMKLQSDIGHFLSICGTCLNKNRFVPPNCLNDECARAQKCTCNCNAIAKCGEAG